MEELLVRSNAGMRSLTSYHRRESSTPPHENYVNRFLPCRKPSNNTKCSGALFSLRSEIVHITFSYWPAFQPAPIYLSTWASAYGSALRPYSVGFRSAMSLTLAVSQSVLSSSLWVLLGTLRIKQTSHDIHFWVFHRGLGVLLEPCGNLHIPVQPLLAWNYQRFLPVSLMCLFLPETIEST